MKFYYCEMPLHFCTLTILLADEVTEGRGIGTYIWSWITYPFYWWKSSETEQPVTEQLLGSTTNNPNEVVDIRSQEITIWCNDQICKTTKCDKTQCRNITCNIYDTNFKGECREYNITTDSDELAVRKTTETTPKEIVPSKPTEIYNVTSLANELTIPNTTKTTPKEIIPSKPTETYNETSLSNNNDNNPTVQEHPLELEAALSSTVNKLKQEKNSGSK